MFTWALSVTGTNAGTLAFPVDCELGRTCFIQQYVDRDPGVGTVDYTCGPLTYQGHRGTDIRLPDRAAMEAGVNVLSASEGVVTAIRDGVPDVRQGRSGAPNVKGKECGNAVVVRRKDGWSFLYCHLQNGSVSVKKDDTVMPGTVLGRVGLSGKTQFPHLHLTIRDQADRVIDPFDARQQDESCRLRERETLWVDTIAYQPGGALGTGFNDHAPDYDAVRDGTAHRQLDRSAPALVFWVHYFGLRAGDRIDVALYAPDGAILASQSHTLPRNRATEYRATGRRAKGAWPPGAYVGTAALVRGNTVISRTERTMQID